jgi:hypothetical protein
MKSWLNVKQNTKQQEEAKAEREAVRESAKAKLLALGLTEEELEGLIR